MLVTLRITGDNPIGREIFAVLQYSKSLPDTTRRIQMTSAKPVDVTVWYDYT